MDSLTQIVLGAACGEVALGKKIGNKAMLFGAIGGTIPDLDVIFGKLIYHNEIDAMAFHRGFMHSFLFSFIGAYLFGKLTFYLYNKGKRKNTTVTKDWIWLFFLSLLTHPILDSFTPYGTQLFLPFSSYRVAFNNISVVDPLYTLPFLLLLITAMFFNRKSTKRRKLVKLSLYLSSFYMLLTIVNKLYIDTVFKESFNEAKISYTRYSVQPTILNNFLWYGIAETEKNFKVGFYSLFDAKKGIDTILTIQKKHDLLDINHPDIQTLAWFSNDYFNLEKDSTQYIYYDLRYPLLNPNDTKTSVFKFDLKKVNDRWDILPFKGNPPSKEDFSLFLERIKGK
ncbi:inner membrane protein [Tenacibaculum sp. MAR_2009_124]|uniref:metal-dependent hydrolase n=1 Tax=Tenacibaculum sp. MAR_2009_124 TaxID=1250059 RepID=UPI000899BE34|nr:metal-dependent hydrolase [Tenacibaculum sp. MAR_2009_124]SEC27664.1 inner membrane protein [Tenacibaculum sp. MAR_2009_124]